MIEMPNLENISGKRETRRTKSARRKGWKKENCEQMEIKRRMNGNILHLCCVFLLQILFYLDA